MVWGNFFNFRKGSWLVGQRNPESDTHESDPPTSSTTLKSQVDTNGTSRTSPNDVTLTTSRQSVSQLQKISSGLLARISASSSFRSSGETTSGRGGEQQGRGSWVTFQPQGLVAQDRDPFGTDNDLCTLATPKPQRAGLIRRSLEALGVLHTGTDYAQSSLFGGPSQATVQSGKSAGGSKRT